MYPWMSTAYCVGKMLYSSWPAVSTRCSSNSLSLTVMFLLNVFSMVGSYVSKNWPCTVEMVMMTEMKMKMKMMTEMKIKMMVMTLMMMMMVMMMLMMMLIMMMMMNKMMIMMMMIMMMKIEMMMMRMMMEMMMKMPTCTNWTARELLPTEEKPIRATFLCRL